MHRPDCPTLPAPPTWRALVAPRLLVALVTASAAGACGSAETAEVWSGRRPLAQNVVERAHSGGDAAASLDAQPQDEEQAVAAPNAPTPSQPSSDWDRDPDASYTSGVPRQPAPLTDAGYEEDLSECTSVRVQRVDVPRPLRDVGGTWELRRVFDTDSSAIPEIAIDAPVPLDHQQPSFEVATDGSDFQVVLFRDANGDIADAQWHQTRCPGARPVRTDVVHDVPATYPTIQAAIDAAEPGDTVRVASGTYFETLTLKPRVTLLGAGPDETILDGQGFVTKLVDATAAFGSSVIGFRLRNVGMGGSCGRPEDGLACSGNHYPVALYADGHATEDDDAFCCHASTFFAAHNVFEGNAHAVMAYHRAHALLFDNVFTGNTNAVVVNHAADAFAIVENNVFAADNEVDIASGSARVFSSYNAFEGDFDCQVEYVQRGRYFCNAFTGSITCDVLTPHDEANIDFAGAEASTAAAEAGCAESGADAGPVRWFDVAGETGRAYGE